MHFFRNHIVLRFVCWFMALYVLNFSVDAPDAQTNHKVEDLSINDMESIAEIILEDWMEIHNAIPEHDESDTTESTITFKKSFDFFCTVFKNEPPYFSKFLSNNALLAYRKNYNQQFYPELTPPPPKA